jgi:TonB family protein
LFAGLRILWLCLGLIRLSLYRRRAKLLEPLPDHLRAVRTRHRVDAQLYLSSDVSGPVTFGFLNPTILLPTYFLQIGEEQQCAAVCHELAHVRRNDTVAVFAEEVLRGLLWFHPCIWWLLDRIQLCREQVVDDETIAVTGDRAAYLETLLTFAQRTSVPDLAPATPFLKRNHLIERMRAIAKEVSMSEKMRRLNALATYTLMPCVLALGIWLLPLHGQTVIVNDTSGVTIWTAYGLLHRPPVELPREFVALKTSAEVAVTVTVNDSGEVTDAHAISGPATMQESVLRSVRGWHFDTQVGVPPKQFEVKVRFDPPSTAPVDLVNYAGALDSRQPARLYTIRRIDVSGLPPDLREPFLKDLPFQEGSVVTSGEVRATRHHVVAIEINESQMDLSYSLGPEPAQQSLKVKRIDASGLPESIRERVLGTAGIQVGDTINQAQILEKLQHMHANEPGVEFAWSEPIPGSVEISLYPRGSQPIFASRRLTDMRVTSVDASALPEPLRQRALERLNVHEGDRLTVEELGRKQIEIREVDHHLMLDSVTSAPPDYRLVLRIQTASSAEFPSETHVEFGPNAPKTISTASPVYPPLAVQAGVRGVVRVAVIIAADGSIQNMQLISGHPLLVPASIEALKQFRFEPSAAEIKTTAKVRFNFDQ